MTLQHATRTVWAEIKSYKCLFMIFHSFHEVFINISKYANQILIYLSYDVASGSEITPCNEIDKPLVVYRFTGNVMTSITTLRT